MSNNLLNQAIVNNDQNTWRELKNFRNNLNKNIDFHKSQYIENKLKNKSTQWKFVKQFNGVNKQQIPNNITFKGKQVTSPKEIAKIANNFFVDKFLKIRENFTKTDVDPIKCYQL